MSIKLLVLSFRIFKLPSNNFVEFQKNGEIIKLTDYHLLYVTDCTAGENLRLTFAKDVRLGQCLHVVRKQSNNLVPVQVSNIQRVCFILSFHLSDAT